jgi:arsenate reductase (thioredoxin)
MSVDARIEPAPLRILFVCVENANRSQMAEAFARKIGGERVEAWSAGSKPSGEVHPLAIEAMKEKGLDLSKQRSKSLDEVRDVEFDALVTMGCGDACPAVRARVREDWSIPDPRDMQPEQFRGVRDLIEASVKALLARLSEASG